METLSQPNTRLASLVIALARLEVVFDQLVSHRLTVSSLAASLTGYIAGKNVKLESLGGGVGGECRLNLP